ncbi:zinc finger protein 382-like isoform X1 [Amphibalanus amphitrite]|uniref:zinc finger protein 382-like isoform X1 n=1 Tax=Amphibalanus amphitrite TaxID=1232801 RepID=UPI001C90DD32|nr:zinc finger protein 382-like isoform X1 [Amphibalanus amphitrite]XP_043232660.1 zinc finger protein 382-like isoform X1 [Amphibalanus amphitrite]XP_043232661.1 zinc finger protein 382-like isoform X1 [Amphibalanus amphitrite]
MASTRAGHTCVLCDKQLETKAALQEHFRDHANGKIKPRQRRTGNRVPQGGRRPVSAGAPPQQREQQAAAAHDHDEPAWQCDSCSETFPSVTAAITHKFKMHPDSSAKHFCPYCGQQFPLRVCFDLHVKSHSDEKVSGEEAACSDCGAVFYQDKAREYHYKSVHCRSVSIGQPKFCPPPSLKIDVSQSGELRSCYYCHLCGSEYTVKYNLVRHLERHEPAERNTVPSDMIRCNRCTSVFFNQRAYTAHLLRHREGDLFVSTEQQRLQVVDRVDQDLDLTRIPSALDRYVPGGGAARPASRAKRPAERADDTAAKSVRAS